MKVCPDCGVSNADRAKFCSECGADLATASDASQPLARASATLADEDAMQEAALAQGAFGTIADTVESPGNSNPASLAASGSQYEVLEEIGRGGMSAVYRAHDTKLNRDVALKRILPEFAGRDKAVRRLMAEARSIANLQHFHIVHVYDIGEDADGPYIAMEYVTGRDGRPYTLRERVVERGPLAEAEAVELVAKLCRGVAHAHTKGVIHRDIKPANVLLTEDDEPKLADFGIARADELTVGQTVAAMTQEGVALGTMDYMSPEQATDATRVDARTDIYSLGAVLYFCLTGDTPRYFRESNVPERIRPALLKALERDREERWESASECGQALTAALSKPEPQSDASPAAAEGACPQCGSENPPDVRFCHQCGQDLSSLLRRCPKCERETRIDVGYCGGCGHDLTQSETACPHCGHENDADVHFCQKCGGDLADLFSRCPKCDHENRLDIHICKQCGHDTREPYTPGPESTPEFEGDKAVRDDIVGPEYVGRRKPPPLPDTANASSAGTAAPDGSDDTGREAVCWVLTAVAAFMALPLCAENDGAFPVVILCVMPCFTLIAVAIKPTYVSRIAGTAIVYVAAAWGLAIEGPNINGPDDLAAVTFLGLLCVVVTAALVGLAQKIRGRAENASSERADGATPQVKKRRKIVARVSVALAATIGFVLCAEDNDFYLLMVLCAIPILAFWTALLNPSPRSVVAYVLIVNAGSFLGALNDIPLRNNDVPIILVFAGGHVLWAYIIARASRSIQKIRG